MCIRDRYIIVNKKCQPRLVKFYTPVDLPKQKLLLEQVYELISQRNSDFQSSFLVTPPSLLLNNESNNVEVNNEDIQIIYKNYATLYFTFIVDDQESELAILDLIQTFVESLDRCFTEVNELDLIFNWQTLESVLEEIVPVSYTHLDVYKRQDRLKALSGEVHYLAKLEQEESKT